MATIDYMICAYGPYSASATGGNGWARDFLAGVLTVPATPFFSNIGASSGNNLEYASTILACISFVLVMAVYAVYYWGPVLRKRSPFAQQLADEANRNASVDGGAIRRPSAISYGGSRRASECRSHHVQSLRKLTIAGTRPGMGERNYSQSGRFFGESRVTPRGTPTASRANSVSATAARSGNRTPKN